MPVSIKNFIFRQYAYNPYYVFSTNPSQCTATNPGTVNQTYVINSPAPEEQSKSCVGIYPSLRCWTGRYNNVLNATYANSYNYNGNFLCYRYVSLRSSLKSEYYGAADSATLASYARNPEFAALTACGTSYCNDPVKFIR